MASTSTHRHTTTIRLSPGLWIEAQRAALEQRLSLNSFVAVAIRRYLDEQSQSALFAER